MTEIMLGVSSCLLGEKVRFDGGHKRNTFILNALSRHFSFMPICPEMGIGLGAPRPALRLVDGDIVRMVGAGDATLDVTDAMHAFAQSSMAQCEGLSGYILKKGSPSCGMERVKIYSNKGIPRHDGRGLFAETLLTTYPNLPVEEEGRLNDNRLRENFIQRVYVYHRWLRLCADGLSVGGLVEFHAQHKFILLAHDEATYRALGPIVAGARADTLEKSADTYISRLMTALKKPATRKRHTNVLMHIAGFVKKSLSTDDKRELGQLLEQYRKGLVPLIVPMTLLRHHLRKAPNAYLNRQYYLQPYPEDLMLRNFV